MSYSVSLPLDGGFLRRECPHCERQFKWHHGPTESRPDGEIDPPVYCCPYCGKTAPADEWWTVAQLEYMRDVSMPGIMRDLTDEFNKGQRRNRKSMISTSMSHDEPLPPDSLHEPSDMVVTEPPCHPWEPIKVDEAWTDPVHCLFCGERFGLG
ncbi:MAG: hypothetical protein CL424_17780 [Acidimicrobiaceae bacterium]|nr:hypothetical protein [Acidimicrobiaceae bacterium]